MSNKHTQGNWKLFNGIGVLSVVTELQDNQLFQICQMNKQALDEVNGTNAKLIAAAPELLELLQYIVNEIETTPEALNDALLGLIKIKALKAINKATL
jgi:hypothetical protein